MPSEQRKQDGAVVRSIVAVLCAWQGGWYAGLHALQGATWLRLARSVSTMCLGSPRGLAAAFLSLGCSCRQADGLLRVASAGMWDGEGRKERTGNFKTRIAVSCACSLAAWA